MLVSVSHERDLKLQLGAGFGAMDYLSFLKGFAGSGDLQGGDLSVLDFDERGL